MSLKVENRQVKFAFLLAAFSALGPFTIDMYLPAFPQMMKFFGTEASVIQMSLTACVLGLSVGQIIMGALSDVHGRRKPLLIAMILFGLSSLGCALAPNIYVLIALRFIQGFAASAGIVISRAIVTDTYSGGELAKVFSLLVMIGNVAPLLAPLAGSTIISYTNWIGVFVVLGVFGLILTTMTTWSLKESLPVEKRVASNFTGLLNNYKVLLANRKFMGYAAAQGILFSGVFAYISGAPFVYQQLHGVSPQVFSILFALNGVSLMLGSQMTRVLTGRMTQSRILQIGLLVAFISSTAVLISVLAHGALFTLVISLFFFNASIGITSPVFSTLAMASQGHIAGSASALLGVFPLLLGSITSPLVGIAGEYSAVPLGILIFAASLLSIIVYVGLVSFKEGRNMRGIEGS